MDELTITAAERVGDHLVVAYEFINRAEQPVFARCLVQDVYGVAVDLRLDGVFNPNPMPSPELAYTMWAGDGCAMLVHGSAPLPRAAQELPPPCALRVEPRGRTSVGIRVPLPILEWHPDLCPLAERVTEIAIDRVSVLLELVDEADVTSCVAHPWLSEAWSVDAERSRVVNAQRELTAAVALLRRNDEVARIGAEVR